MKASGLFLYKLKLSSKMKELEEKTAEHKQLLEVREDLIQTQQKLNEMEQLKEQEKIMELRLEAKDSEIQAVLQQLTECREEIKTLTQERDYLKQKEESLQAETDQLKEDIKDTVSMVGILPLLKWTIHVKGKSVRTLINYIEIYRGVGFCVGLFCFFNHGVLTNVAKRVNFLLWIFFLLF